MIPDFLQNPGGIQRPVGRSNSSESGLPADSTSAGSDFAQVFRDQQASRPDRRATSSDAADRTSRRSETAPAPSTSEVQPSSRTDNSNDALKTSASERSGTNADSRPLPESNDGGSVDRPEERPRDATPGADAVDLATDQRDVGSRGPVAAVSRGDVDSDEASRYLAGTSTDNASDAEPADFSGVILVDGFLTEFEATTATDDGLQLDVADDADQPPETPVDDESQIPIVELQPGQNSETTPPLVLSSLVSIAVAESALLRRQQVEAGQGGALQDSADEPIILRLPERPSIGTPDGQAAQDDPSAAETSLKVGLETPVLRSLVAARDGYRAGRPMQNAISQNVSVEAQSDNQTNALPRSEPTPQTLTVGLPAVRSSIAGTPAEETAAANSGVAQIPAGLAESSDAATRLQTAATDSDADVILEVSRQGDVEGLEPTAADRLQRNTQQLADQVASAADETLVAGSRSEDTTEETSQLKSQELGSSTASTDGDRQAVSENETASDSATRHIAEISVQSRNAIAPGRDRESRQQRGQVSGAVTHEPATAVATDGTRESSNGLSVADDGANLESSAAGATRAASTGSIRVETQPTPTNAKADDEAISRENSDPVGGQLPNVAPAEGHSVGSVSSTGTPVTQASTGETRQSTSVVASVATSDQASASSGAPSRSETTVAGVASSAVSASGDSVMSPASSEPDSPVSGGPDRFLSPNVQRALSAIQSAASGGSRLRVQLNPVELGSLLVEIEQTPQGIVARLEVGNAAAHRALVDSLSDLQQSLSRSQSAVDRIDVVLTETRTETSRQQREQGQQRDQPEQRGQQQRGDAESDRRRQRDERATTGLESDSESGEPRAEAA